MAQGRWAQGLGLDGRAFKLARTLERQGYALAGAPSEATQPSLLHANLGEHGPDDGDAELSSGMVWPT